MLTKEEMNKIQHDMHTEYIKDSRKHTEQEQFGYSVGTRTIEPLRFSAHNTELQTNDKAYKAFYFWSISIHSKELTLLDVLWH